MNITGRQFVNKTFSLKSSHAIGDIPVDKAKISMARRSHGGRESGSLLTDRTSSNSVEVGVENNSSFMMRARLNYNK